MGMTKFSITNWKVANMKNVKNFGKIRGYIFKKKTILFVYAIYVG